VPLLWWVHSGTDADDNDVDNVDGAWSLDIKTTQSLTQVRPSGLLEMRDLNKFDFKFVYSTVTCPLTYLGSSGIRPYIIQLVGLFAFYKERIVISLTRKIKL